jgi:hypothetical protein
MTATPHLKPFLALASLLCLVAAGESAAVPIETVESGTSTVKVNGAIVADQSDAQTDGRVSTVAIFGTHSTPEVRTAARSSFSGELASNVRMDDKMQFSNTHVTETISAATLALHSPPDNAFLRHASLDFLLPRSFMEVTSNAELPRNALEMVLLADLRVCFATICGLGDSVFSFQSILTASWQSFTHSEIASGDPSLDLTPLLNPTITDNPAGFLRTTTLDFDAFHGHLDLGIIPASSPFTVEYQLQTRGSGDLLANIGLAGINDPFLLDTDPVQAGALVLLIEPVGAAAAPEPQGWALLAMGLALVAGLRRRAGRVER